MSDSKLNTSPYVIGYWACIRGLTLDDVLFDMELRPHIHTDEGIREYDRGFRAAEAEQRDEKLVRLRADLRTAYEPGK